MDAFLELRIQDTRPIHLKLTQDVTRIGRANHCEINIARAAISREHAQIIREGGNFYIEDCGSQNGTFMAGLRITGRMRWPWNQTVNLANEVELTLTDSDVTIAEELDTPTTLTMTPPGYCLDILQQNETKRFHPGSDLITIGRSADNDLCIPDPFVSRQHLIIKKEPTGFTVQLQNTSSHARLCVNGKLCHQHTLQEGDKLEVGRTTLVFHALQTPLEQPVTIGRYHILDRLGQGAFGVVYLGEDPLIKRKSAIKVMLEHMVTGLSAREQKSHVERMIREAQTLGQLDHPNIVRLYDADYYKNGIFLAMEYVQGLSLDQLIGSDRDLPLDLRLHIALQACEGLQAIHDRGLIHRDIKSANLILTKQNTLKIMDFGMVHIPDSVLAQTENKYMGTPAFMAPERFEEVDNDFRSDIFSLGVVIYQLVTGKLPFEANTPQALMYQIVNKEPAPPSRVNGMLNAAWDAVLLRALAKQPGQRFSSCKEFHAAMTQRISDTLTAITPPPQKCMIVFYCMNAPADGGQECQKEITIAMDGIRVGALMAHGQLNFMTRQGDHDIRLETVEPGHATGEPGKNISYFTIKAKTPVCYFGIEIKGQTLRHVFHEKPPAGPAGETTLFRL